jgi:hypothetical protein
LRLKTWVVIKFLRHSGIRIEELIELSHHSFDRYRLPATGKLTQEAAWTSH